MSFAEDMGHDMPLGYDYDEASVGGSSYCSNYVDYTELISTPYLKIEHTTEKAWLVKITEKDTRWLPKSKCKMHKDHVQIPRWLT